MRSFWIHILLLLNFLSAPLGRIDASEPLPPLEAAVERLPEDLLRALVLKIVKTVVTGGTDELARHLYDLSLSPEYHWAEVRSKILSANQGQPLDLKISAHRPEIERANRILVRSGIDFISFSALSGTNQGSSDEVLPEHKIKHQRLVLVRRIFSPVLVFSIALAASYLESAFSEQGSTSLRPAIAMATTAGVLEVVVGLIEPSVRRRIQKWSASPALWPGLWEVSKNTAFASLIAFSGSQFADLPSNPVPFEDISISRLAFQIVIASLAMTTTQIYFGMMQKAGALSEYPRSWLSSLISLYTSVSRSLALIPGIRVVGEGLLLGYGVFVGLPMITINELGRRATLRSARERIEANRNNERPPAEGSCRQFFRGLFFKIPLKKR